VFGRGQHLLGIDFAGGDTLTMSFAQKVEITKIREAMGKISVTDAEVDYPRDVAGQAGQNEVLRVVSPRDTGLKVEQQLKSSFPEAKFERIQFDQVGPVVGQEIQKSAVLASLLALFGILVYVAFRYEFSFAVGAVVAKRAIDKGIKAVLFDRGGYIYHGRVKALADAAREAGLQF